jgi:hypothetical protein
VLNALLAERGRHLVHAAAVGTEDGAVLLTGPPGAGKSSTALACLGGALGFLADDWCGVRDGDAPGLFSLYASAKLRPDNLLRFPELAARLDNFDRLDAEKGTLFLAEERRARFVLGAPARAILVPEVTGASRTKIEPLPGKLAWRALVSWTLAQLPHYGRESIALLTRFCGRLPTFRLALGADRDEVRATLESFVAGLSP